NVTGLSVQTTDLAGKRLELLRDVVPQLRRVAIIANVGNPARCGRHARFRLRLARSASKWCYSKSDTRRILPLPSRRSQLKRTHFTSCKMHSPSPTQCAS